MGPLHGLKIVEMAGIGPGPVAAMLLADMGATIIRIDRKEPSGLGLPRPIEFDVALRNRKSIRVDLKETAGRELVLDLVSRADALIEGFRPGVLERLGLGPDVCLARNPKLVYGRVTGWGQDGPLAHAAGHDINYIALTGVLHAIGRRDHAPTVPLNVIGDYGGGSLYLALGMLAALLEARTSGKGQVVDAAIVDGVASLMSVLVGLRQGGMMTGERGTNLLDSGAPFYDVYECADGKYISIGSIEPKFYRQLLELIGVNGAALDDRDDPRNWPQMRETFVAAFRKKTRAEWTALLEGTDACFAPVMSIEEAHEHPHLKARGTYVDVAGVRQPAPAPRFSRTPSAMPQPPTALNTDNATDALRAWLPERDIETLRSAGVFC